MRWSWVALWAAGCSGRWCPVDPFDPGSVTCGTEHEPCGRDQTCAHGLDCVSTVLCAVGPCPGTCLAACIDADDCGDAELCQTPSGWSDTYCVDGPTAL